MIIHASLKTDITSFYMKWFITRLKEGYFDLHSQKIGEILRYSFKNNPVEKIFLHTKNPYKIIKNFDILKSFKYKYEIVTYLTMYDKFYESKLTDKYKIFDYIRQCALLVEKDNNSIGYGPIFKTITNDFSWHVNQFKFLCKILHKSISTIYYDFSINNLCKNSIYFSATPFIEEEQEELIKEFQKIANKYNLKLKEKPNPETFQYNEIDIGEENTCPTACKYCKYVTNAKTTTLKMGMHSPESSLLIGKINSSEKITNIKLDEERDKKLKLETKQETVRQFSLLDFI